MLIISSTNRPNSNTRKVAEFYKHVFAEKGISAEILSLEDLPHSFIFSDVFGNRSTAFQPIQDQIADANKFIFIVPEYNGSFPGILKGFLDACAFPESFYNKKALLVGISSGRYGNIRGIDHLTGICNYMHLNVMSLKLHLTNIREELNSEGKLHRTDTLKFVNDQIDRFIQF